MQYKEVHNLEESLAILDKYKNELTKEQYKQNKSIICNHAMENMYANEQDIIELIQIDKNEKTASELISQHKREWGCL